MIQIQSVAVSRLVLSAALVLGLASPGLTGGGELKPAVEQAGEEPLRIYIRAGKKTHGPGQHDHPRFLAEWTELLNARGARATGSLSFPGSEELAKTDVLVMYAAEAATIEGEQRADFERFLQRGGGLVVVHDAACGSDPEWFKTRSGGAWEHGHSKWLEGKVGLYFSDPHPITRGVPHFDLDDEIYYDLQMDPRARVLASGFHDVFSITPQMWVIDEGPHRAFVTLQGHQHSSFSHPAFRTLLLRGIAWAGNRDVDSFCAPEELSALRYPPGGPLHPDRAAEPFALHEDFEIELVACEPLVVNPITIDWDWKGRTWVAQTPGYPYKEEFSNVPAHDEITILEDTDGDGRLDSSKTFADGLDLITSFVFHGDGVIVTQAPDILWLRDRDGDDVADERITLFTGFGYGDTHAVTSNLRWGLDGWIYGTQGYSGGASRQIRSPYFDEGKTDFGHIPNGIFRFLPDGSAIEPYSVYGSNTWGLDFSPDGELFFTMANGSHLRHVLLSEDELGANRLQGTRTWREIIDHRKVERISKADRAPYVQIDFVGGFTAAAGSTIYSGGVWPEEFEGNHFVCEPTVNLVHRDLVTREGEGFKATKPRKEEFLASTDPWFRPIQTRIGPDGALYVLDFYNQAAVHNDTRGPRHGPTNAALRPDRDRHHGRIWRVQHSSAPEEVPAGANFWSEMAALRGALDGSRPDSTPNDITSASPAERIRALWQAFHAGQADHQLARMGLGDQHPGVRRNAALMAGELQARSETPGLVFPVILRVNDRDSRVQLAALGALRHFTLGESDLHTLVPGYVLLDSDLARSAFIRMAQNQAAAFLEVVIAMRAEATNKAEVAAYNDLIARLLVVLARAADSQAITVVLEQMASTEQAMAAGLGPILRDLQNSLKEDFSFGEQDQGAAEALAALFANHAENVDVTSALLPLAARIQDDTALRSALVELAAGLFAVVENPEAELDNRLAALETLLELPSQRLPGIAASERFLHPYFPPATVNRVVEALAETGEIASAGVLVRAFPQVSLDSRELIFRKLIARPAWTEKLLDAIESGETQVSELGPRRSFQLREHADVETARRSRAVLASMGLTPGPETEELIASLLPVIAQPPDLSNGRELFVQNCAVCHRYEGLPDGVGADVGPALTGMGAHGAEHLLPFIVDPNRSVEAAYLEYVAETVDGELLAGVLTYDGPDAITLSYSGGEHQVRREDIESLRSTGRSPMPTGFEELGAEGLRDILGFLCQEYEDYRIVDIEPWCTASTALGLYDRSHDANPLRFEAFGVVDVLGTPMEVLDPASCLDANNAIVLKGGARDGWQSKVDMPQAVEIPVGFAFQRMHVLGGISAWGDPFFGDGDPAVSWTFNYADKTSETVVLHDGQEFADWIRRHDVPGSTFVEGLVAEGSAGQVRTFAIDPSRPEAVVESIRLESFDNRTAPTFLGLTAQLRGAAPAAVPAEAAMSQPRVLIMAGGSSHDWEAYFEGDLRGTIEDSAGIKAGEVAYTEDPDEILPRLAELDVLVLSNNQPLPGTQLRKGVLEHVGSGGGLLIVHAATWFNWDDWPEYYNKLVQGGSRSHEAYGTFDIELIGDENPITIGLPASFEITDELYRFEGLEEAESPIEVLAIGTSRSSGESYPVVWRVPSRGEVICTTLGHDGAAHQNPHFQRLIRNAVEQMVTR